MLPARFLRCLLVIILSVSGTAASFAQYQVFEEPDPEPEVGEAAVALPVETEFSWRVSLADGQTVLSGSVPSDAARNALRQRAGETAIDLMTILEPAPPGFLRDALRAINALSLLESGEAEFDDGIWSLSGMMAAGSDEAVIVQRLGSGSGTGAPWQIALADAREQGETEMSTPPESETADVEIPNAQELAMDSLIEEALDPSPEPDIAAQTAICREEVDDYTAQRSVLFGSGSARLTADSEAMLTGLAQILAACPSAPLYIEGHTDADGSAQANLLLSISRAEAVVDALVGLGVGPERLYAVGYGASLPIASNDTAAGKAQNRRIVFNFEDIAEAQGSQP